MVYCDMGNLCKLIIDTENSDAESVLRILGKCWAVLLTSPQPPHSD